MGPARLGIISSYSIVNKGVSRFLERIGLYKTDQEIGLDLDQEANLL